MGDFKSCPVCREQSDQCLSCASYVVEGERIYYEKLKGFGATKDHEVRFINRIQKHCTTAFFHNGKLYIPSRQGRSVPLAIGLQWNAWQEQQAIINVLKAQLECCRKENAVLLGKVGEGERRISFLEMNIKYVLDHFDMNDLDKAMPRVYEDLKEALRGKHE
ncbi:hypothetical protein [Acinetobacter radioresistens]|uniref:Uncharacterized protein n=1 Tax=uncultured Caudovirales phage TaxID=2100421 RepID=A0A2H4J8D3_9CAUD|nr:hypothetical protein [Acinetobacter radioresistens]ASN69577.1 hypothetical protein 2F2_56 [uncultured Caudovirales phage]MCM1934605.1 hypothetical protein [Acinetobacter radioresistens]MCM1952108.1 hypothetical protein [Acinetobacter radioresistens]